MAEQESVELLRAQEAIKDILWMFTVAFLTHKLLELTIVATCTNLSIKSRSDRAGSRIICDY